MKTLIAPSLLAADFLRLDKAVEIVNSSADIFHMDVMDGTFVPNLSFGFPVVEAVASQACKPLDVHLMIVNPQNYVERFAKVPWVEMISFHYEAAKERTGEILDFIRSFGCKAGIAINPDCPVESIFPYLEKADFILIMSVFAGFGGQKFIPESLQRIARVRERLDSIGLKNIPIEVDGGVGPGNAEDIRKAGAQILVAGSSVFRASDPASAVAALRA